METVRTVEGEVDEILERISPSGDAVAEVHVITSSGKERCIAFSDKADVISKFNEKMQGLAKSNGCSHIRELKVRVEISGILKNQASSKDIIVTAVKLSK